MGSARSKLLGSHPNVLALSFSHKPTGEFSRSYMFKAAIRIQLFSMKPGGGEICKHVKYCLFLTIFKKIIASSHMAHQIKDLALLQLLHRLQTTA